MNRLTLNISTVLKRLTSLHPADPKVALLRTNLVKPAKRRQVDVKGPALAIESVEDSFYFALFGAILAEATRHGEIRRELVVVRATNGAIGVGWSARVRRSVPG